MKTLNNVTLITIDGLKPDLCLSLLKFCGQKIRFGKTKLVSFEEPKADLENVEFFKVKKFNHDVHKQEKGCNDYNEFIINELYKYIDTEFVLTVQTDGFITHPELWDDDFLNYDYIGSPWPKHHFQGCKWVDVDKRYEPPNLVGNGGLSLRSKRFIDLSNKCPRELMGPEDCYCCINNYDYFISHGIRYAPTEVASKFSRDNNERIYDDCFGFHGNKHFINGGIMDQFIK